MKIDYPDKPFDEVEPFKEWYFEQVEKNVKGNIRGNITKKLPRWTDEEKKYVFRWCRANMNFPKKVSLQYAPNAQTLFSKYKTAKNKYIIALPTSFLLITQFPRAAKAGLQHEFGHILNGDCIRYIDPKYRSIQNEVYDVAINANIQRDDIDALYRTLFDSKTGCPFVPDIAYPKWGLPVLDTGWTHEVALDACYNYKQSLPKRKAPPKPDTYIETPVVGDIIRVGEVYARVTEVDGKKVTSEKLDKTAAIEFIKRMKKVFEGDNEAVQEAISTGYINVITTIQGG